MKHTALILTLLAISGCTLDEARTNNPELRLMFQPDMLMQVASEGVRNFPQEQSIGVSAWKLNESISWEEGAEDAEPYLTLSEASGKEVQIIDTVSHKEVSDVLWVIDEQPEWPDVDEHLTFMAFSPYSSDYGCDRSDGVTCSVDILQDQVDLPVLGSIAPGKADHPLLNEVLLSLRFTAQALCVLLLIHGQKFLIKLLR